MKQIERLKSRIEESGLKKAYLARKIGVSPQLFTMMLNGNATMPEEHRVYLTKIVDGVLEAQS